MSQKYAPSSKRKLKEAVFARILYAASQIDSRSKSSTDASRKNVYFICRKMGKVEAKRGWSGLARPFEDAAHVRPRWFVVKYPSGSRLQMKIASRERRLEEKRANKNASSTAQRALSR
jgi:endo-beta-N-acetylglucosaminidase D